MAENMTMDDVLIFIDNMKVLELSEFVKRSRRDMVFCGSSYAVAAVGGPAAGGAAAVAEEKTSFDVILNAAGRQEDSGY